MTSAPSSFSPVRDLRVAVTFLTRVPAGWISGLHASDLAGAAWAFPVVGILVGGIGGAALYGAAALELHPLACALIGIGVMALVTGALHEDGLADVADGIHGRTKTRTLEIMRDSRIGSFGVLALIFVVGIRASAVSGVPGPGLAWGALVAAAAFSRGLLPLVMYMLPPAREDGLSRSAGTPTLMGVGFAFGLGLIVLFVVFPLKNAVIALLLTVLMAGLIAYWAWRRLRGQTGDVLGAVQQATEMAVLMAAAGWSFEFE